MTDVLLGTLDYTPTTLDAPSLQVTVEPKIHGVVGSQFGDLEFDVGKSVRWAEHFCNDMFITDVNTGVQRYWVINWSATFPDAEHNVTGRNFFTDPVPWRKEQFAAGDKAFGYNDADWCFFIDAHEGLSFDIRSLPTDYNAAPFMSWMYREIQRAVDAGLTEVAVPFFTYLKYDSLQNVTYATQANDGGAALGIPPVQQPIGVPWYLPYKSLVRIIKVSALRNAAYNWSKLDQPANLPAAFAASKIQIVSYAYAHWNIQDIPPGQTTVPPLDANNDLGYQMRNLISLVRPIPGILFGTPWHAPNTDPTAFPGPWAVDATANVDPGLKNTVEESGHTPPNAATTGIRVPMYDQVMRINLRDGLWYEHGESGNVPLTWDTVNQTWVPAYDPDTWPDDGIDAEILPPPTVSALSLRLNGTAGTYVHTDDANYFDFSDSEAFTMVGIVSFDNWHPATRSVIVSKWGAAGQRSWYWAVEAGGGMVLVVSQDGTASQEYGLNLTDGAAFSLPNGTPIALAVTFATNLLTLQDETQFWMCPSFDMMTWQTVGPVLTKPNPTQLNLFASTTQVQIGAYLGSTGNAASYYRVLSIRRGIGEQNGAPFLSYDEVGIFRGDTVVNPAFDRYGNLWQNTGAGWSYANMPGLPV